jgi:hypothetical protein
VDRSGFTFRSPGGPAVKAKWVRHAYDPAWIKMQSSRLASAPPGLPLSMPTAGSPPAAGQIAPGEYIAFAPPEKTSRELLAEIDRARTGAHGPAVHALDSMTVAAADLPPGAMARVKRFCLASPLSTEGCSPSPVGDEWLFAGDRWLQVFLPSDDLASAALWAFTKAR